MTIISLIGIDGSGKTTQALMLCKSLQRLGYDVKCLYAGNTGIKLGKYLFYLSLPVDIVINRILKIPKESILKCHKFRFLVKLESWLLFLNYMVLVLPQILLRKKKHQILITDRYVYDYVVQRLILEKSVSKANKLLLRIVPKPDLLIVLDVDEKIAFSRKREDKTDLKSLKIMRRLYLKLGTKINGHVVNASKDVSDVFKELFMLTINHLRQKRLSNIRGLKK